MVTGRFAHRAPGRFLRRTLALYSVAVLLYLPLNWYAGDLAPLPFLREFLFEGTFYHLWYFPAVILGLGVVHLLQKMGKVPAFCIAVALYLIGLAGDSYYGFAQGIPFLKSFYAVVFAWFGYTRNGLFFAPLFLLLGTLRLRWSKSVCVVGFLISLCAMSAEAFWLRNLQVQRHDSAYFFLPVCMLFLFAGLLAWNDGQNRPARQISMLVYLSHPWWIVFVRGVAKLWGGREMLVENSLLHFGLVLLLSFTGALFSLLVWPRPDPRTARAWREIDTGALLVNARALQRQSGCPLMAVVKADGYGHGAKVVARTLQKAGVHAWAVACLSEGISLRKAGIRGRILILGYTAPSQAPLLSRWRLTQTLADEEHAAAMSASGWPVRAHLALDTGMHRLGIPSQDTQVMLRIFSMPGLRIEGVFSHLCVSDEPSEAARRYTSGQTARFWNAIDRLRSAGVDPGEVHLYASYGVLNQPPIPCAWVRAGIALYGVYSGAFTGENAVSLQPVLALRARIATVRTLAPGQGAGYGLAFVARRKTRLATVTIGYADGLPRDLSERGGRVLVRGTFAPVVGRLCMDQMLVDVTDVSEVRAGDVVTLIGKDGSKEIRVEELAVRCHTISNELLAGLNPRLGLVRKGRTGIKAEGKDYDSNSEKEEGKRWIYRFCRTILSR